MSASGAHRRLLGTVLACAAATVAGAGPWSELPEAVSRLQLHPDDRGAQVVLARAEQSLLNEAGAGHLAATAALMDAYSSLVAPLSDADRRIATLEEAASEVLLAYGDTRVSEQALQAGMAWGLAAQYHATPGLMDRLRRLLLPPEDADPGQVWVAAADGAELVWHAPMRFVMGCTQGDGDCRQDERYLRWIEVPGVWIDRTEVTNDRYRRCAEVGACSAPSAAAAFEDRARGDEPVAGVSWFQARDYARWVGRRLPSEAEWERCARGKRVDWRYPWGNSRQRGRANVYGRGGGSDDFTAPSPVKTFYYSGWGIYDISGNVWEWCEDTFHEDLIEGPRDGAAWTDGGRGRVLRGGSWRRTMEMARVSSRIWHDPDYAVDDVGFRCATGVPRELGAAQLVQMASLVFPVRSRPGSELEEAQLTPTDRRYLERRTVTWLALEGRAWEALPVVVALLGREIRDPVALDLLDRLEDGLVVEAEKGRVVDVERKLGEYRTAVGRTGSFNDRSVATEKKVLRGLEAAGREKLRRGDRSAAAACFRAALGVSPGDPQLVALLRSTLPAAGSIRIWDGDGREMVWIPASKFLMGRGRGDDDAGNDEQPAHTVWVEGFWLDRTAVTNAEYRRCVEAGTCTPPGVTTSFDDPRLAQHPVLWVDWYQARAYAGWAGKRLPTETEWELAARAGQPTRYPWGDHWGDGAANAFGVKEPDFWSASSPVGSFPASPWGAVDMLGNAWEWVEDVYHSDYRGAPRDGRPWLQVTGGAARPERVLRGGSFVNFPPKLRVSQRDHRLPVSASKTTGFRCAVDGG